MYCPNCGQQQVSEEMRFCSRCGLALSGLAEWMAGGMLVRRAEETRVLSPSRRRKQMRRAAKLMFFSGVLIPIGIGISAAVDDPGPMVLPALLFFASIVWMVYARLFIDDTAPALNPGAQQSAFGSTPTTRVSLPPQSNIPDFGRQQVRTNELAQAPSVTEHTTKLLDHD
jgi:endogenous inhibitor of DNA gyrase (YacG/DUF329 family)